MVTPAARREAVAHLRRSYEMSERRACAITVVDRSMVRYCSKRPDDGKLRCRMRELAGERRRFGYRRLHVLLRREGLVVNRKRTQRLYRRAHGEASARSQASHRNESAARDGCTSECPLVD